MHFFRKIFTNPVTNEILDENDLYKRKDLEQTLTRISKFGADEFYSGLTAKNLVEDIQQEGSIITLEDLKNYRYPLISSKAFQ